jgi:hypothetical protein
MTYLTSEKPLPIGISLQSCFFKPYQLWILFVLIIRVSYRGSEYKKEFCFTETYLWYTGVYFCKQTEPCKDISESRLCC